jgi:hypothetical protein
MRRSAPRGPSPGWRRGCGAFAIAELDGQPAIMYLETAHDGQTLEDPGIGAAMSLRFDALRTEALTGRASLSLIEKVTEERWTS